MVIKRRKPVMFGEKKFFAEDDVRELSQVACLNRIYCKVNESGLSNEVMEELREDIDYVAEAYGIDDISVVLFAAILEKSSTNGLMDDEDLAEYLGCTNIIFIRYHDLLLKMDKAGIIKLSDGCSARSRFGYRVTTEAIESVESNAEFKPVKTTGLSSEELFTRFRQFFVSFRQNSIDCDRLLTELDNLVRSNDHLVFCRKVLDSALYDGCSDTERRMFFYLCHRYVIHGNKSVEIDTLTNFTSYLDIDDRIKHNIARESMPMQRSGLVSFAIEDGFVDTDSLSLSDSVKKEFFTEIEIAQEESVRHRDLIPSSSIHEKELFYNEAERHQMSRLENLLDDKNFKEVQNRLSAVGMRKGFNAIFYGAPGTGKTASALELARRSGRDIFRIDVSKLRDKWVGESEKAVRGVFKIYRSMCHSNEIAPILFFNEADAIFSKRIEDVKHSTDQLNNTIQNIILEELENIDGILIATTNLLSNLDPAFERRFIFKVEFKMPEKDARTKIWKSMIPNLSEDDAAVLADRYLFSGGNIENIARKSTVDYVLSGKEATLSSLDSYCKEEMLGTKKTHNRVGF